MSNPTELWKEWEGRIVDEKFPLQQWVGGSDHSAVFLTERSGRESQKAVVKLIPAEGLNEAAQLSYWASAAKLSHPHLLRLFECGRCQLDNTQLLYVAMEYAEENLAELLPLRPLSAAEGSEMLPPLLDVLSFLHQAGYAHGRIKPANIMAVDNQLKISADSLIKIGDRGNALAPSAYDAPEVATAGPSPAADIWSLALTLVAVMTQSEPQLNRSERPAVPDTIPQPLREIVRQCLQVNPRQRCSVGDILRHLQPEPIQTPDLVPARAAQADVPERRSKRWILAPIIIAALLLVAWVVNRFISQRPQVPAAQPSAPASQVADMPVSQSPAPFSDQAKPAQRETVRGGVLQQVLPDVSRSAQSTITGTLKVSVQVSIDDSGNVSQAKFVSAGPSKYFANLGLATARRWKFNPPQVDGRATTSEWILRFQFKRTSTQVFPAQVRP